MDAVDDGIAMQAGELAATAAAMDREVAALTADGLAAADAPRVTRPTRCRAWRTRADSRGRPVPMTPDHSRPREVPRRARSVDYHARHGRVPALVLIADGLEVRPTHHDRRLLVDAGLVLGERELQHERHGRLGRQPWQAEDVDSATGG